MQIELPRRHLSLSLTPLIDVVFILLVFFMLASNFMQWRSLDVSAPGDGAAESDPQTPLVLRLEADGSLQLDGQQLVLAELPQRLAARLADRPGRALSLQTADEVSLQRIVSVLDRLKAAGMDNVTLTED